MPPPPNPQIKKRTGSNNTLKPHQTESHSRGSVMTRQISFVGLEPYSVIFSMIKWIRMLKFLSELPLLGTSYIRILMWTLLQDGQAKGSNNKGLFFLQTRHKTQLLGPIRKPFFRQKVKPVSPKPFQCSFKKKRLQR